MSLEWCAETNDVKAARKLIRKKADVNERSTTVENTPLHVAALRDSVDVAKLLVEAGADINAINKYSQTPLMYAAVEGSGDVLQYLLSTDRADASLIDSTGKTAAQLAKNWNQPALERLILDYQERHSTKQDAGDHFVLFQRVAAGMHNEDQPTVVTSTADDPDEENPLDYFFFIYCNVPPELRVRLTNDVVGRDNDISVTVSDDVVNNVHHREWIQCVLYLVELIKGKSYDLLNTTKQSHYLRKNGMPPLRQQLMRAVGESGIGDSALPLFWDHSSREGEINSAYRRELYARMLLERPNSVDVPQGADINGVSAYYNKYNTVLQILQTSVVEAFRECAALDDDAVKAALSEARAVDLAAIQKDRELRRGFNREYLAFVQRPLV